MAHGIEEIKYRDNEPYFSFEVGGVPYRAFLKQSDAPIANLVKFMRYLYGMKAQMKKKGNASPFNPFATRTWNQNFKQTIDAVREDKVKEYWDKRWQAQEPPEAEQTQLPLMVAAVEKLASSLEAKGLVDEAYQLDVIANTIDNALKTNKATLFFDELQNQTIDPTTGVKVLDIAEKAGIV